MSRKERKRRRRRRRSGNSFLCLKRATTMTTTTPIPQRYTFTLFYYTTYHLASDNLKRCCDARTHPHSHARLLRAALEKLDLCWLLDMLCDDMHDSSMDFHCWSESMMRKDVLILLEKTASARSSSSFSFILAPGENSLIILSFLFQEKGKEKQTNAKRHSTNQILSISNSSFSLLFLSHLMKP